MPKVSLKTRGQAKDTSLPGGYSGRAKAAAYFDQPRQPLHLHLLEVQGGEAIHVEGEGVDKLLYVWSGAVNAGGHQLAKGSSLIVERGSALDVSGSEVGAVLLAFSAATAPAKPLRGGNVHLLPAQNAPRSDNLGGSVGLGGVMHADADCPTCQVWLHENRFPGRDIPRSDDEAGVHSHSEDEVIFVIDGEICLGKKLYGPGTALAIAADTLYSFTAGPKGLHFVNFRAAKPGDIQFAKGPAISETSYWRERLPRPEYLSPLSDRRMDSAEKLAVDHSSVKADIGSIVHLDKETLLSGERSSDIRRLLEERAVLIFPQIHFTDEEHIKFTQTLGGYISDRSDGATTNITIDPAAGVSANYTKASFYWHFDGYMNEVPILGSILCCIAPSSVGGNTEFCNTYAAWEALPESRKLAIEGLWAIHGMVGAQLSVEPEPSYATFSEWLKVRHNVLPLVWTHRSGRKSLVIGNTAVNVLGMDPLEGLELLVWLRDWATQERFRYSHTWSAGDAVLWDNTGTLHRATPYNHESGRIMRRTKLAGEEPFAQSHDGKAAEFHHPHTSIKKLCT